MTPKNKLPAPVRAPFDLPKVAPRFKVFIEPRIAAVMELSDEDQGSEIERESIYLIYPLLIESDGEWCFTLPHHYGLKDRERKFVEKSFNTQLEFQARSLEFVSKIAQETGRKFEEIQKALQQDPNKLIDDPVYAPYVTDFVQLLAEQQAETPYSLCVATAHMQRVVSEWTIKHTQALHPKIYDQLLDFAAREDELANQPDGDEGNGTEALASNPE
jgi:hypothetical protein